MSTREVTLDGGSPWGFRMHGGADAQQPLRIARVNPGSKAAQRGIREGDLISSINGQSTRGISNSEAHALLKNAGDTLVLGLNQETTGSPKRRAQKQIQDSKEENFKRTSITSTSSIVSNTSTINRTVTNSQQSNESTHTNGVGEHKDPEDTTNSFQSYIKNGTPYTTPRGASNDGQSRDTSTDDTARNHRSIHSNESVAGDDSVITALRDNTLLAATIMADNVCGSSRSRNKRRSRSNRKRSKKYNSVTNQESQETTTTNVITDEHEPSTDNQITEQLNSASSSKLSENNINNCETSGPVSESEICNSVPCKSSQDTVNDSSNMKKIENCTEINDQLLNSVNSAPKSKKLDSIMVMVSPDSDICIVEFPKTKPKINSSITICEISDDEHNTQENNYNVDIINSDNETLCDKIGDKETVKSTQQTIETKNLNIIVAEESVTRVLDVNKLCGEIDSYKVEYPKPVLERKNSNNGIVKSRSLDDDEQLKITELTDDEKSSACVSESQAIVSEASEAESDVEWETTAELAMKKETSGQQFGKMTVISLPLEEHVTYETSHISPEDERSLRDFLEGLNLVNSPEESVKRIETTSSSNTESVKMKRAKKRAALAQHFMPYYQNPRYLDVISEEGSDLSDRDNKQIKNYKTQMIDTDDDDDDDVFEDMQAKYRNKFQSCYAGPNEAAILVGTKLIDHGNATLKEGTWSTSMIDAPSGAEVVYLEDSSNSMTPSDLLDETTGDLDADDEEDISIDWDKTYSEHLDIEPSASETSLIKNYNSVRVSPDMASRVSQSEDEQIELNIARQPTPPSTPNTPANDTAEELKASNKTSIDFLQPTLPNISNNNIDNDTFVSLNDGDSANSSVDIKTKLKSRDGKELMSDIKVLANSMETQSIKENEEELSKEFKNLCECLKKPSDEYSSQIDSTPNVSRSDSTTSSRSTSQCTAVYNPLHSSLTNIAAMLREGSFDDKVERLAPAPLREICVRALLSMPFGKDIIEELANVSQSIEEMTCRTPSHIRPDEESTEHNKSLPSPATPPIPPPVPPRTSSKPDIDASSILLVDTPVVRTPPQKMERWIGMPTEENPNLLVCLSPSQKEFIDKTRTFPNEADSLLDLHRKYIERRGYHEEHEHTAPTSPKKDGHTVPAFKIKIDHQNNNNENNLLKIIHNAGADTINNNDMYSAYNTNLNYNNYVKQFTREIPMHELKPCNSNQESNMNHGNIRYDKYIKQLTREVPIQVEKQINKPVNNKIYSAALSNENTSSSRLKARHLGEWLNLARNECDRINNSTEHIRELHNLHSSVNKLVSQHSCEERFSNSSDATFERGTSPRRYSLPFNLYEKQMQYILEKEREIEREIEKLKEEKSSLENHEKMNANHINIPVQHEFTKRESATDRNTFTKNETFIPMATENKSKFHSTELFKELHVTPARNNVTHEKTKEHIIPIRKETGAQTQKPKYENNNKYHFDFTIPEFQSFMEEKSKFESNENFKMSFHKENKKEEKNYCEKVEKSIPIRKEYDSKNQTKMNLNKNNHSIPVQKSTDRLKYENTELFKELYIGQQQKPEEHIIPIHKEFDAGKYQISRKGDIAILNPEEKLSPKLTQPTTASEKFRQEMYNEYMCKIAERQERKQNKVIKIQISPKSKEEDKVSAAMSPQYEVKHVTGIEDEFMNKVREKKGKLGDEDSENDGEEIAVHCDLPPVKIIDGSSMTDAKQLPKHLQEFIDYTTTPNTDDGVWSPGKSTESTPTVISHAKPERKASPPKDLKCDETVPVVWTPRSAGSSPTAERKEFRPVSFESPTLSRKNKSKESTPAATPETVVPIPPPWEGAPNLASTQEATTTLSSTLERKLTTSQSAPVAGLNNLGKLPRAQNPTITLLQKAREGQLPRGASYIEDPQQNSQKPRSKDGRPPLIGPGEILYTVKNEYTSESDSEKPKKMADLGPRKFEGIGPTTKDGMPIVLRSEVKESNQAKWYKRMYDTLHRARNDDEYVTVRYKTRRGRYPYTSAAGYLSEPEPNAYDSDAGISASKYATLDRRRLQTRDKENEYITYTVPRNKYVPAASVKHTTDVYKNQPGRIENYVPGHSSISEKEAKEWWDEVMEIFDGHLEQQKHVPPSKSFMSHALKESGYESDSTLVFRRREDAASQLSPHEQKEAYKTIQKGGDVPLHGLRKLAPERPKEPVMGPTPPPKGQPFNRDSGSESPRKYVEDEVTIHYRSPVRHEIKEAISEEELARRQAEAMRRIYQEERRRKYLQELQDMNSRRHTDNFIPSQKSPISLNRYDDFIDDLSPKIKIRDRSPEPRLVARALYNFVGQSARELTFRKGDVIFIRRQVDKNWYEGEHNAMIGLFPSNYVEIIPYDGIKSTPRKANEGQARAKFNFIAQTHLELSLAKGELVVLTRRVDDNWFEGRIGNRKGIFPVSYVDILIDPSEKGEIILSSSKPVASPAAHSLLLNGSSGGKESMGSHHYQPNFSSPTTTTSYHAKPVNVIGTTTSYQSITRSQKITTGPAVNEALHIDTHHSEPVPYRALYKYRPQNDDELELQEGDTVFVLEKCDDGWYVGSSQRTGAFGTFPGNYVERI